MALSSRTTKAICVEQILLILLVGIANNCIWVKWLLLAPMVFSSNYFGYNTLHVIKAFQGLFLLDTDHCAWTEYKHM